LRKADSLPPYHPLPLSQNLGTLTSLNPLGPSGPVTGLLYLYLYPVLHLIPLTFNGLGPWHSFNSHHIKNSGIKCLFFTHFYRNPKLTEKSAVSGSITWTSFLSKISDF